MIRGDRGAMRGATAPWRPGGQRRGGRWAAAGHPGARRPWRAACDPGAFRGTVPASDVDSALTRRWLIVTWLNRGTLHLVRDPATDVAVVQVAADHLTGVPLGDSDALKVGDYVVAVGNPFGLGETVTFGIVSALGRSGLGIEGYEDFIQTDASINPGNSGGALVNLDGEVVGINTAIVGPSGGSVGIGFAIPINMARDVMDQLIAHGEIKRAQLGVTIQDLTPDLAKTSGLNVEMGAVVNEVIAGSPADKAGIKAGDVITKENGRPISGASDLRNKIGLMSIGSELHITLIRNGGSQEVTAVLTEAKVEKRPPGGPEAKSYNRTAACDSPRGLLNQAKACTRPLKPAAAQMSDPRAEISRLPGRQVPGPAAKAPTRRRASHIGPCRRGSGPTAPRARRSDRRCRHRYAGARG